MAGSYCLRKNPRRTQTQTIYTEDDSIRLERLSYSAFDFLSPRLWFIIRKALFQVKLASRCGCAGRHKPVCHTGLQGDNHCSSARLKCYEYTNRPTSLSLSLSLLLSVFNGAVFSPHSESTLFMLFEKEMQES